MSMNPADWAKGTREYLFEVQGEYNKITWPPQKEAISGTVGVIGVVAVVTTVLGLIDFGLSRLMHLVIQ